MKIDRKDWLRSRTIERRRVMTCSVLKHDENRFIARGISGDPPGGHHGVIVNKELKINFFLQLCDETRKSLV